MSDIAACYILQYLVHFDEIVKHHHMLLKHVKRKLKDNHDITLFPDYSSSSPFLSCFSLLSDRFTDDLLNKLRASGIFCRKYYDPLDKDHSPNAVKLYNRIICIPCTKDITKADIDKILHIISVN